MNRFGSYVFITALDDFQEKMNFLDCRVETLFEYQLKLKFIMKKS
jgi:hypothetical protein